MGKVRPCVSPSRRKALHYLAAELRKGRSVAALRGRRYAEYVHHVRQADLIQCAQFKQHLAVLTVFKLLPTFQAHQAIYVVEWAEMRLPGSGNNPDNPVILAIIALRATDNSRDSGDMLKVFQHVCMLQSNKASFEAMSPFRRCWPLHDPCFNVAMLIHATSRPDSCSQRLSWPIRFLRTGGIAADRTALCSNSWLQGLSEHFGIDVADYFAWIAHYVNCLWFLGVVGLIFTIIDINIKERDYDCYFRPMYSIVLMLFVAAVIEVDDPFESVMEAEAFGTASSPRTSRASSPTRPLSPGVQAVSPLSHDSDSSVQAPATFPSHLNSLSPCSSPPPVKFAPLLAYGGGSDAERMDTVVQSTPSETCPGSRHPPDIWRAAEDGPTRSGCAGEAAEAKVRAGPPAHNPCDSPAAEAAARETTDSPAPHAEFETEQPPAQAAPEAEKTNEPSNCVFAAVQEAAGLGSAAVFAVGNAVGHVATDSAQVVQDTAVAGAGVVSDLAGGAAHEINDLLHNMMERPNEFYTMAGDVVDMYNGLKKADEPWWVRWSKTLMMVPLMVLYFLAVQAVFVLLFWFEMWVIFSWGQCSRINEENGDEKCTTPVHYRGPYAGFFMEILPSVSEGILLELLLGVSKAMSAFVCDRQNWSTQSQYEFAFFIQCVLFEMSGKVGFVLVLAFFFVPTWGFGEEGGCEGTLDYMIFGSHALSCIKTKVSYKLRRRLLERSMKGPMLVSMLVAMLIKVILPRLITDMLRSAETDLSILKPIDLRQGLWCLIRLTVGACCSCWRCFWRLAGLIFLFDCEAVGGPLFMIRPVRPPRCTRPPDDGLPARMPAPDSVVPCGYLHELPDMPSVEIHPASYNDLGQAAGNSSATCGPSGDLSEYGNHGSMLEDAFYQGMRKEFCVLDEYLEQLLHFTFFTFFGMVWPLGCTFALMNYLLEFRFDILKLGYVRRRSLPKPDQSLRRLIRVCTRIIAYMSIIIQVALMLYSYEQLEVWFPSRFGDRDLLEYTGEWVLAFFIMIFVMVLLSWASRWLVKRLRLWRKRRRLKAMAALAVASGFTKSWGSGSPTSPSSQSATPTPPWRY